MYPYGMTGGYWPQQMMGAQPMQQPAWMQSAQPQLGQQAQRGQRMDSLTGKLGQLQEQYKAAPSDQQAAIQQRMTGLQGRIDTLQPKMGDPNATGADRAGMGWRQERRKAKAQGEYDPGAQAGGMAEPFAMGGGMPGGAPMQWGGGMPMGFGYGGGYGPQFSPMMGGRGIGGEINYLGGPQQSYQPQQQQVPQMQQGWANNANAQPGQETIRGFYNSPFGQLTTASGGHANVFKQQGGDESTLYHYDPNQGWKSMTADEYRGYGDGARQGQGYADPSQYAGAGALTQQFQRTNVRANRRGY